MCADAMKKLLSENKTEFDEKYHPKIIDFKGNTYLQLSNAVTSRPIQWLPLKTAL
jgi:hypothetical protein